MPSVTRQQQEATRLLLIRHLSESPATAAELSALAGIGPRAVRFHLRSIEERGWTIERTTSPDGTGGRPEMIYRLTPRGAGAFFALALDALPSLDEALPSERAILAVVRGTLQGLAQR